MTVYIEKPAVNLREELASLRNQGGYQEQQFYFDGLVTNGTFDADTNWVKGTGWTISGGAANKTSIDNTSIYQTVGTDAGRVYQVSFDVSISGVSGVRPIVNGVSYDTVNTIGTHTFVFVASGSSTIVYFNGGSFNGGSIDNVSIFETDGTDVVHTMPKGWVPKDVYEDGLLQREGAAHDYEVVYDGFDYFVKPTVAPSATTQTCVIGVKA